MIVDDFDIRRTRGTARPFKAKPPLHVNADAELPLPVTMQCLKAVARQGAQIIHGQRGITGDTALRLGHWFGMNAQFWLNLQGAHDIRVAEERAGDEIAHLPVRQGAGGAVTRPIA